MYYDDYNNTNENNTIPHQLEVIRGLYYDNNIVHTIEEVNENNVSNDLEQ